MKSVLFLVLFIALTSDRVRCDDGDDDNPVENLWQRLKAMVKEVVSSFRDIWNQLKSEIKARSADMKQWTQEMFDSFKIKMKEWVDDMAGASDTEKQDMRNYIERLEMPKDTK